jgi:tRNA 2-thiouridine synthesizing protein A
VTGTGTVDDPFVIDAVGLLCPQPVIRLAQAAQAHAGAVVELCADDPAAATDVPAWCRMRGMQLIATTESDGVLHFVVRLQDTVGEERAGGSDSATETRSR